MKKLSKPQIDSFWCKHENKRHEFKVYWQGKTEEYFTCLDCNKKFKKTVKLKESKNDTKRSS